MNGVVSHASQWLDVTDAELVAAYERAFYVAFERASHNRLVRWLWEWDEPQRRLRTRIPYAEQRIWVTRDEAGTLVSAIAVNTSLRQLQSAAYGFVLPQPLASAAAAGKVCEFLTLFILGRHGMAEKARLWREIFAQLRQAGFTYAVATTAPKVYPLYKWAGATLLAEAEIEGEIRYFLQFDLQRLPLGY